MKNDSTWQRFEELRLSFKEMFVPGEEVVKVGTSSQKEEGVVVIQLVSDLSLPQVWVLKNGKRETNFAQGNAICSVTEGDLLTIDSRYYNNTLWYKITSLSSTINNLENGDLFRTSGNTASLGIIKFNNKL
jgi:hypothetical protein